MPLKNVKRSSKEKKKKKRKPTPFSKSVILVSKTICTQKRVTHLLGHFLIEKPSINSCNRHKAGRVHHLAREIRTPEA